MGPNIFAAFFMLLLSVSGGGPGNDALDLVPTDAYWRIKGVTVSVAQLQAELGAQKVTADIAGLVKDLESLRRRDAALKQLEAIGAPALEALQAETKSADPEAAAMAQGLVDKLAQHGKERAVRRLMAIRTLGERKEQAALPLLKALTESKELFVADYAQRAIGQIEGTPRKPADHRAELAADLKLFPADTGIVGQTVGLGLSGYTLETFAAQAAAMGQAPAGAPPPGAPAAAPDKEAVERLTREWLGFVEQTGNVRIDSVSVAVSNDIGGTNNWVMLSFHGMYDREAMSRFAAAQAHSDLAPGKINDIMTVPFDREATLLLPSDRQAVFVAVDTSHVQPETLLDPVTRVLSGGEGGALAENKALDAAVQAADKSGVAWMVALPSITMRSLAVFQPFESLMLRAVEDKDVVHLTVTAKGAGDPQPAIDQFNNVRDMLAARLQTAPNPMSKDLQPLVDALQSAKAVSDEKGVTATATLPKGIVRAAIAGIIASFRNDLVPGGPGGPVVPGGPIGPGGPDLP